MLKRLTVRGFKSIRTLEDFELRNLNVLIGANGAGKSNFIALFQMLARLMNRSLRLFVREQDGPNALLFGGRKRTKRMKAQFIFDDNGYEFSLVPAGDGLVLADEATLFFGDFRDSRRSLESNGQAEALLPGADDSFATYVRPAVAGWRVYHFHDTSPSAAVRHSQAIRDNQRLKPDASNLAPFLRRVREQHSAAYRRIVDTIRAAAPFFGDFVYRQSSEEAIDLEWSEYGDPDTVRGPRQLSDGTLRFICLATLLLQPNHLRPNTLLIDEPELGLHPYAVSLIGALLQEASEAHQVIVSTQSVDLISELQPQDIVVVSRRDGESVFERPDPDRLRDWLEDYALGELWKYSFSGSEAKCQSFDLYNFRNCGITLAWKPGTAIRRRTCRPRSNGSARN